MDSKTVATTPFTDQKPGTSGLRKKQTLIDDLRRQAGELEGRRFGDYEVELGDDFSYTDPVDGSLSAKQGVRIGFAGPGGGSRIVYRLSGTGTEGATLRVYIERHEPNPDRHHLGLQTALADLIAIASQLAKIEHYTGRSAPDVIT